MPTYHYMTSLYSRHNIVKFVIHELKLLFQRYCIATFILCTIFWSVQESATMVSLQI